MRVNTKVQFFLLLLSIFIPDLFNIHIFGLNLTFGRVTVIIIFLLCFLNTRGKIFLQHNLELGCVAVLICWIGYGMFYMLLAGDMHKEGIKELVNIFFGILLIYSLTHLVGNSRERLDYAVSIIEKLVMICILVGLIEIITGMHLATSCFQDTHYVDTLMEIYESVNYHQATGFQYGTNDFSAFLTFFFPIFLLKKKRAIYDYPAIGAIAFVCAVNSATLCILTIGLGIALYLVKEKRMKVKNVIGIGILLIVLYLALVWLESRYGNIFSLTAELENHLHNYKIRTGSSYKRFHTYMQSIGIALDTFPIGIGPANFTNYVLAHPRKKMLMNPHNLWLEILTEYGILIFMLYIILLFVIFGKAWRIYKKGGVRNALLIQIMLIDYVIVGIVPSTFISYWYQWILIALGIAVVNIYEIKTGGRCTAYGEVERNRK